MDQHLLSIVLLTPLAGLAVLLFIPGRHKDLIRVWANLVGFAGFLISLPLVTRFAVGPGGFQFEEKADWIPSLGVHYHLGIDGISLLLVMLTTLMGFLSILCSWSAIQERVKEYYAMFLLLQAGMLGVFISLDFFLFYVFWELVLVPMYFIIGVWGGPRKLYAAIKFFLYTLAGSVLMLLGILTLYFQHFQQFGFYTLEISELMKLNLPLGLQQWVFWAFFVGFAIKVPMFPFHTWLPDAHVEAPTAGSVILAAVLLKMGTYGFLRFSLPLLPKASVDQTIVQVLAILSLIGIIYGALVCLMQADWKKLIAYSSVSHLGFCTLGIFSLNPNGIAGSVLQQINHGISTGMLFLVIGVIYERRHTREIKEYGGLAHVMPKFAVIFAIAMLSSAGLPLLNGFIGEFTILQGAFEANRIWAAFAVTGVILGAAYLLWLYQRTILGQVTNGKNLTIPDMNPREIAVFLPLIAWAIWIGVYPKPYFDILRKPVAEIVERVRPGYYGSGGVQNAGAQTGAGGQGPGAGEPVALVNPAAYSASSRTAKKSAGELSGAASSPAPGPQPLTPRAERAR
ncbi:MAG TPA: NADH-quinone oxidoreductase subunit M [Candidatus Acidoferrales bacterium]|nr:NADH-quinone oxidoreductase subunit M [Candidatus Acidoferrales bacterium]